MPYRFFPPVVNEQPLAYEPEVLRLFSWPRGRSVVRTASGYMTTQFVVVEPGWVEGRDYFVGGHHYDRVPLDIVEALIAAGYEPEHYPGPDDPEPPEEPPPGPTSLYGELYEDVY